MINYYEVLEVKPNSRPDEIKSSFRRLAKKYHPDRSREEGADAKMRMIIKAYDTLINERERSAYDQKLRMEAERNRDPYKEHLKSRPDDPGAQARLILYNLLNEAGDEAVRIHERMRSKYESFDIGNYLEEKDYLDCTPLAFVKEGLKNGEPIQQLMAQVPAPVKMFLGNMGGSIGEVAAVALLIGLVYLLIKKIITWHIPVSVIGSIALFTTILWLINPEKNADPVFHLLAGGILLGAIFMATDYVTSPMTPKAMIIYGCGIGVLTVIIRVWGAYPEGVSFAILIMNAFVPLMNSYIKPKRFGEVVKNG